MSSVAAAVTIGLDDSTTGALWLYGSDEDVGGELRQYNAADADGTSEYWKWQSEETAGNSKMVFGTNIATFAVFTDLAGVDLYHAGTRIFSTTATGIELDDGTGNATIGFSSDILVINNTVTNGVIQFYMDDNTGNNELVLVLDTDSGHDFYVKESLGLKIVQTGVWIMGGSQTVYTILDQTGANFLIDNTEAGGTITLQGEKAATGNSTMLVGNPDGAAELYYAGTKVFETTATGIQVASSGKIKLTESGSDLYLDNVNAGQTINIRQQNAADDSLESVLTATADGSVALYFNGNNKLETFGQGVYIVSSMTLYNDGSGDVQIKNTFDGGTIKLTGEVATDSEKTLAIFDPAGAAELYHAGVKVIETAADGLLCALAGSVITLPSGGNLSIKDADGDNLAIFIANAETRLYHNNSLAFQTTNTGGYFSDGTNTLTAVLGAECYFQSSNHGGTVGLKGENLATGAVKDLFKADPDGAAELYYAGNKELETRSDGIKIDTYLEVYRSGGDYILDNVFAGGTLILRAEKAATGDSNLFVGDPDGAAELYYAGVKKFETAADGVIVSGNIQIQNPPTDDTASGITIVNDIDVNTVGIGGLLHMVADGSFDDADADAEATCSGLLALATTASLGSQVVLLQGTFQDAGTWNWTPGAILYASTTVGQMTETKPSGSGDIVRIVGYAITADVIYFDPDKTYIEV
jgi:hypothetical protein